MADGVEDFREAIRRRNQQRAGATMSGALDGNPAEAARTARMAKYLGIAPSITRTEPEVYQREVEQQRNRETIANNPWMAGPLQNPDMAALIGSEELERLGAMVSGLTGAPRPTSGAPRAPVDDYADSGFFGRAMEFVKKTPAAFGAGYQGAAAALSDLYLSIDEAILPITNPGQAREILERRRGESESYRQQRDEVRPQSSSAIVQGLLGGPESTVMSLTALAVGLASRSPKAAAAVMGVGVGAPAYQEAKREGLSTVQSLKYGFEQGGIEALTELMPAAFWLEAITKRTPFGQTLLKQLATEVPGEQVATALGDLSTWVNLNPEKPFSAYLAERPEAALSTALATISGTSIQVGGVSAVQSAAGALVKVVEEKRERQQATVNQTVLDKAVEQTAKSEMAKNAPDEYAAFVQQGVPEDKGNVYVPVEAIDALLADETLDEEQREVLTMYQSQIEDARPGNNDVVIPTGEFLARFTGSLYQSLRDDVRMTDGGSSPKEAAEFEKRKPDEIKKLDAAVAKETPKAEAEAVKAEAAQRTAKQQVFDLVYEQTLAGSQAKTEADRKKEAQTTALLAASRAENLATERYGAYPDAMAAWKDIGFSIAPKGKGRKGAAKSVATQPQVDTTEDVFASSVGDGTGQGTEGVTRTVEQSGPFPNSKVTSVVYHGTGAPTFDAFNPPIFVTEDRSGAEWYEKNRGEESNGRVIPLYVDIQNPLDARSKEGTFALIDVARRAGVEVTVDDLPDKGWSFEADEIMRHSPYDGTNPLDLLYIPAVREQLKAEGYDSVQADDVLENTDIPTWVVLGNAQVRHADSRILYQTARGKTDWSVDGSTVVTLFATADFSTMLHEMSHVFLEQEFKLAQGPNASERLKADVETIKAWMAANGHPVVDGVIPVEAHELWARTGERYFREGKAPSAELRGAFAQFKTWLRDVYKSIQALTAYGPAPITQDIREIMDRIIATSDAIADNIGPLPGQKELGMTDAQYAALKEAHANMKAAAEDDLLAKRMADIRRRDRADTTAWRRTERTRINQTFNEMPANIALHLLRTGNWLNDPAREPYPIKLHTGWLIDTYGEEILDQLPVGLQKIHRGDGVGGMALDIFAQSLGIPSADALVKELVGLKAQSDALKAAGDKRSLREAYVSEALNAATEAHFGRKLMTQADIEEEAKASIAAQQGDILLAQIRQIRRRQGKDGRTTQLQVVKLWARDLVGQSKLKDVLTSDNRPAVARFVRALSKARNAFTEASLKGDMAESERQLQAQLVNGALLTETKNVGETIGTIVKRMRRYAALDTSASIHPDYMDRIHDLLADLNFRQTSRTLRAEQASFKDWAEAQPVGFEVHVPRRLADSRIPYTEMTVAEVVDLDATLQSLIHLGKTKQRMVVAGKEREVNELKNEIRERILNSNPERDTGDTSIGEDRRPLRQGLEDAWREKDIMEAGRAVIRVFSMAGLRAGITTLLKIEALALQMDGNGNDTSGPAHYLLSQRPTELANQVSELHEEVMQPLVDIFKAMPGRWRSRLRYLVDIPEITLEVSIDKAHQGVLGEPMKVTRLKLIGMLLNTGNLSNLQKMVDGEKWIKPGSRTETNTAGIPYNFESMRDLEAVRKLLWSHASAGDREFVQAMWDGAQKLWPHIVRVERAMTGITPEKVDALPFTTDDGTVVRGGYWPVVWDSARSKMGQDQADTTEKKMFGIGTHVGTQIGHSITRTGATAPMDYNFDRILTQHLNRVISRVVYAEWVRDVLQVVDSGRVMGALNLRLGREYGERIKPWIRDQIPSSATTAENNKWVDTAMDGLRLNVSGAVLGASYLTMIAQPIGLANAAGHLGEGSLKAGAKWLTLGLWATVKHHGARIAKPGTKAGPVDFVFARSGMMARRMNEFNQETIDAFRKLNEKDNPYQWLRAHYFYSIAFVDLQMVAVPAWMGGYAKALGQGKSEPEAAAYADSVVRLTQGTGRKTDLAEIQRGSATQKLFVAFYTPGSVLFNQLWASTREVKSGNYAAGLKPLVYTLALSTLLDAWREGDLPEDEDEDGMFDEIALWVSRNMFFGAATTVPLLREVANPLERKIRGEYSEFGSTLLTTFLEGSVKGGLAAWDVASDTNPEGEDAPMTGKQFKDIALAAGMIAGGAPGLQIGKTGKFLIDVKNDEAKPEGTYDWYHGLAYGKLPEKEEAQ